MKRTLFGALVVAVLIVCAGALPWHLEAQQSAQNLSNSRCNTAAPSVVVINTASSGNVELVALTASQRVYVCGFTLDNDTATTALQFVYGTGTACDTGETDLTGAMTVAALTVPNGGATHFATAAGNALCIELGAATQVNGYLTYVKY